MKILKLMCGSYDIDLDAPGSVDGMVKVTKTDGKTFFISGSDIRYLNEYINMMKKERKLLDQIAQFEKRFQKRQ